MAFKPHQNLMLFSLAPHPLQVNLTHKLNAEVGQFTSRLFPDGEFYLRLQQSIVGIDCVVLADLSHPNKKYLQLIYLLDTLKELGANSVGLVASYLSYMRQDCQFMPGEAITSKVFANDLSQHIDWLVTVDPHLHRYQTLDEIYAVPNKVVQAAPALAKWLKHQQNILLVGPDEESHQWVSDIAVRSSHPYVIANKSRFGDKNVSIILPKLAQYQHYTAVIIDDVIASGETIKQCINALKKQNISDIKCVAIHGIFVDACDRELLNSGLSSLITTNTIAHYTNQIDVSDLLISPILTSIQDLQCIRPRINKNENYVFRWY